MSTDQELLSQKAIVYAMFVSVLNIIMLFYWGLDALYAKNLVHIGLGSSLPC